MDLLPEQQTRLDAAFDRAGLSSSDREFWVTRLQTIPFDTQNRVISLFELFPEEIRWLAGIQTRKEAVLQSRDRKAWQAVVAEERDHLAAVISRIS